MTLLVSIATEVIKYRCDKAYADIVCLLGSVHSLI